MFVLASGLIIRVLHTGTDAAARSPLDDDLTHVRRHTALRCPAPLPCSALHYTVLCFAALCAELCAALRCAAAKSLQCTVLCCAALDHTTANALSVSALLCSAWCCGAAQVTYKGWLPDGTVFDAATTAFKPSQARKDRSIANGSVGRLRFRSEGDSRLDGGAAANVHRR